LRDLPKACCVSSARRFRLKISRETKGSLILYNILFLTLSLSLSLSLSFSLSLSDVLTAHNNVSSQHNLHDGTTVYERHLSTATQLAIVFRQEFDNVEHLPAHCGQMFFQLQSQGFAIMEYTKCCHCGKLGADVRHGHDESSYTTKWLKHTPTISPFLAETWRLWCLFRLLFVFISQKCASSSRI
jgi:hypothetical protein